MRLLSLGPADPDDQRSGDESFSWNTTTAPGRFIYYRPVALHASPSGGEFPRSSPTMRVDHRMLRPAVHREEGLVRLPCFAVQLESLAAAHVRQPRRRAITRRGNQSDAPPRRRPSRWLAPARKRVATSRLPGTKPNRGELGGGGVRAHLLLRIAGARACSLLRAKTGLDNPTPEPSSGRVGSLSDRSRTVVGVAMSHLLRWPETVRVAADPF